MKKIQTITTIVSIFIGSLVLTVPTIAHLSIYHEDINEPLEVKN